MPEPRTGVELWADRDVLLSTNTRGPVSVTVCENRDRLDYLIATASGVQPRTYAGLL